jgi:hypothetical protein
MSLSKHFDNWPAAACYNNGGGGNAGISHLCRWLIALQWLSYWAWWSGHQESGAVSPHKVILLLLFPVFTTLFLMFIILPILVNICLYSFNTLIVVTVSFSQFFSPPSFLCGSCFQIFTDPWAPKEHQSHNLPLMITQDDANYCHRHFMGKRLLGMEW